MNVMQQRLNATRLIARRELRSTLYSIGIYVVMTAAFLIAAFLVNRTLYAIQQNGLMVLKHPFDEPLYVTVVIGAIYLALCSALAISRERDLGTIEVLFYGPVDAPSYVLGKYFEQMITFVGMLVFYIVFFYVLSLFTNFGFTGSLLAIAFISIFVTSTMVGFGILLSALTKKIRTSVLAFLLMIVFFLAFDIAYDVIMSISGQDLTVALIYLRVAMQFLNQIVEWLSPIAYLKRGISAVNMQRMDLYLLSLGQSLLYTVVLLGLSILTFNWKGVKK